MKIFFSGSIRGGDSYRPSYRQILDCLKNYGELVSEHIPARQTAAPGKKADDFVIYARDVQWIREADLLVAEVSQPSIGVGYEIALAENLGIPVLALYDLRAAHPVSAMIAGNRNIALLRYASLPELWPLLNRELARARPGDSKTV